MKLFVSILLFILLVTAVSAEEETFHHFFGEVTGFDDIVITAQTARQDYKTKVQNGKYGYDPAFKVTGEDGQNVRFYVGTDLIKEVTLFHEGLSRVDLVADDADIVTIENVPQPRQRDGQSDEREKREDVLSDVSQRSPPSSLLKRTIVITAAVVFAAFFLLLIMGVTLHKRAVFAKNAKIIQYAQAQRKQGIEKAQIAQQLQQSGWQNVEEIMRYVK